MPEEIIEKNSKYYQKSIYSAICAQYIKLWQDATEDTFIRDMFGRMIMTHLGRSVQVSGDEFVKDCILKNSMHRQDLVVIACGYLVQAISAEALDDNHLAWTYLMDAQRYVSTATYAGQLREEMPEMEADAALEALKSSKRKGGQNANKIGRIIGDKAIDLIKTKGAQGKSWPKVRDAVRDIKPDLWPFMQEKDPGRSEENYERSVVERLQKRTNEFAQFLIDARQNGIEI